MGAPQDRPGLIEATPPRVVFTAWVAEAASETRPAPSPLAEAYLVDLLAGWIRAPGRAPAGSDEVEPATLAEAWIRAQRLSGGERIRALRGLGDRALFVSGYFGESLLRSPVGSGYYRDMGRSAYAALAHQLDAPRGAGSWSELFEELADRFPDLASVLAGVSDRAYSGRTEEVLAAYERYRATGSERARRRLVREGVALPRPGSREPTQ